MKSSMKKIVLTCFLFISVINEFSLAQVLELGITGEVEDEVISLATKFPVPLPILDDGKLVTIDPNFQANTLEETKKQLSEHVVFYLYTPKNSDDPQKLYLNDTKALKKSYFDPQKPTRMFVHGWINSYKNSPAVTVRKAYMYYGVYNFFVMDWSAVALNPYRYVSKCVIIVSQFFATKIDFLVDHGTNVSQLHVAGHSLGAHIAGLGSRFCNYQVPYVIGIDPAYPGFEDAKSGERISDTDGDYVVIIHASGGHLGFPSPIGDVDFFPNGGEQQRCAVDTFWICSHFRAVYYFAESIISKKGFWSWQCDSYDDFESGKCNSNPTALMGTDEPDSNVTGVYYLNTAAVYPYALGHERIVK